MAEGAAALTHDHSFEAAVALGLHVLHAGALCVRAIRRGLSLTAVHGAPGRYRRHGDREGHDAAVLPVVRFRIAVIGDRVGVQSPVAPTVQRHADGAAVGRLLLIVRGFVETLRRSLVS